MERTYTVVLRDEPEGGFTVLVPALPEIVTHGDTVEQAKDMAVDAIRCAVLGRQDLGEPVPEEDPIITVPEIERTGNLHICRVTAAAGRRRSGPWPCGRDAGPPGLRHLQARQSRSLTKH